jgi:hypothetical protein
MAQRTPRTMALRAALMSREACRARGLQPIDPEPDHEALGFAHLAGERLLVELAVEGAMDR